MRRNPYTYRVDSPGAGAGAGAVAGCFGLGLLMVLAWYAAIVLVIVWVLKLTGVL